MSLSFSLFLTRFILFVFSVLHVSPRRCPFFSRSWPTWKKGGWLAWRLAVSALCGTLVCLAVVWWHSGRYAPRAVRPLDIGQGFASTRLLALALSSLRWPTSAPFRGRPATVIMLHSSSTVLRYRRFHSFPFYPIQLYLILLDSVRSDSALIIADYSSTGIQIQGIFPRKIT